MAAEGGGGGGMIIIIFPIMEQSVARNGKTGFKPVFPF